MLADTISAYGVELRRLRAGDIERVRQWRNHPAVAAHMLNRDYISAEQQRVWYQQIEAAVDRAYYLFCYRETPSGVASVQARDGQALGGADRLEAAIYLAPESEQRGTLLAFAPALALNDACFTQLVCQKLDVRVREENRAALRFNAAMGYHETSRRGGVVFLTLTREAYLHASRPIKEFLCRTR